MTWSLVLALLWVSLFAFGLIRHRVRGLWLLLGAPFALYWPAWIVLWWVICARSCRMCG